MSTSPPKVKPSPLPENTGIGGYRVLRRLAAGGFGVVYLALDREGQQVAIKEYLPASLPRARRVSCSPRSRRKNCRSTGSGSRAFSRKAGRWRRSRIPPS